MKSHRMILPVKVDDIDNHGELIEEIRKHLEHNGVHCDGVSIENVVPVQSAEGTIKVEGPFLRVFSNIDPTEVMTSFSWEKRERPSVTYIKTLLQQVESGKPLTNAELTRGFVILAKALLNQRATM